MCVCVQESLEGACAQVSQLQQREKERERDIEKDKQNSAKTLTELERIAQVLEDRGLIRMERSDSGSLDVQIIAATNTDGKSLIIYVLSYGLIRKSK